MTKNIGIGAVVVAAILGAVTFFGFSPFIKLVQTFGTSAAGSTGTTARQYNIYGVNLAAPGPNATSSSLLNSTGQDIYPTMVDVGCEQVQTSKTAYTGSGLAALTLSVGTSSTAAPNVVPGNLLVNAYVIGTSTGNFVMASTTSVTGNTASTTGIGIWPNGTYLTFWFNATNTAVCTVGVSAFSS